MLYCVQQARINAILEAVLPGFINLQNFMRKTFELFNDNSKLKTFCFCIKIKQLIFRAKKIADR